MARPRRRSNPERVDRRLASIEEAVARHTEQGAALSKRITELIEAIRAPASIRVADRKTVIALERGLELRQREVVRVDQPLALISQAQRSGGTLLARLFDGHPHCHVHPDELQIGDERPHLWPRLGLDEDPAAWFDRMRERRLSNLFVKGRREIPLKKRAPEPGETHLPFMLPPDYQRRVFLDQVERGRPIRSEREILDCYMTSLFNAWLDNQNLRGPPKRWVVAFSPRRAWDERLEKLFELYPEGRLISILRDPMSWIASAWGRSRAGDPMEQIGVWKRSVEQMLEALRRYPKQTRVARFEELILDTPAAMRGLAEFLEIEFDPILTTPTFNRQPTGPNSSYEVRRTGIVKEPVEGHVERLPDGHRALVRRECEEIYRDALAGIAEAQPATSSVSPPTLSGAVA